jgi:glutathione S-transferase
MLTLYDFTRSGNAYKARLMLSLLGLGYERRTVDLTKRQQMEPWFLALNPLHQLPVLDDDGHVVRDSSAILVYLGAKHGAGTWYPTDPAGLAEVQQWLSYGANEMLHKMAYARAIALGLRPGDLGEAQKGARELLAYLEASLNGRSWLTSARATIADIAVYPYAAMITQAGVDLEPFPALRAWLARIEALPGYVAFPTPPFTA